MSLRRIVIISAVMCALGGSAWARKEFSLVSIDAPSRARVQQVANMGIDIWDVTAGRVTAAVVPEEINRLRQRGFTYTVLFATREELERSVRRPLTTTINYRNHDQVVAAMQAIAVQYPSIAKLYIIGTTYENRPIWALKIGEKVHLDRSVPAVLYCGEHHAREWIAVEVPLRLAEYIVSNYATSPDLQRRLNRGEIWIVPMTNPDGYVYSWTTDRWWRKNRRPVSGYYGVDPNRNYGYHWGDNIGSSPNPWDETYRGPSAFSEKETQAIRDLDLLQQFKSLITYHNYSQLIIYPWGYTTTLAPDDALFKTVSAQMSALIQAVHGFAYTPGHVWETLGYYTSGDTTDWAYGARGMLAYTIEVRPQGYPYFELPPDQIIPTFEENLPAAMYFMDWTENRYPAIGIEVFANRTNASFSVTGPASYSGGGSHWVNTTGVPNGSYTITCNPVPGWIPPAPQSGAVNSTLLTFEVNYTPDYRAIVELKARADGQPAAVQGKTVAGVFSGYFYVQEPDRSGGIRVNWTGGMPAEGATVSVVGTMTTSAGERAINAQSVQ